MWQKEHKQWLRCYRAGKTTIDRSDRIYNNVVEMLSNIQDQVVDGTEQIYISDTVWSAVNRLDGKDRDVVVLRYGLDYNGMKTLAEVGNILGLTRERIRQIEFKALHKLRKFVV